MTEAVFEKEYTIQSCDVNASRVLKTSKMFEIFQDIATQHCTAMGYGTDKTLYRGLLWVITTQSASISRMPSYEETVVIRTWAGKTMHVLFPRYYSIQTPGGEHLVDVSSLWALIDEKERSIAFPGRHDIRVEGTVTGEEPALPKAPAALPISSERDFAVPYSYTDLNGHMNNVRYFDLAEDIIYETVPGFSPRKITIRYNSEILCSNIMKVGIGREENRFFITGDAEQNIFKISYEI